MSGSGSGYPSLYGTSLYGLGEWRFASSPYPSLYETSLYAGIKKGEGETPYPSFLPYTGIGSTGIGSGETPDPSFLPYTGLVESKTCEVKCVVKLDPYEASRPDPEADPEAYDEWLLPSK